MLLVRLFFFWRPVFGPEPFHKVEERQEVVHGMRNDGGEEVIRCLPNNAQIDSDDEGANEIGFGESMANRECEAGNQ